MKHSISLGLATFFVVVIPNLTGCPPGAGYGGLDKAACPELGSGAASANFSAEAKANAAIRAFVSASADVLATTERVEAEVTAACVRMGTDLGLTQADMAATSGEGGKAAGACNAVAVKMDAILKAGASARIETRYTPPVCRVSADAHASCSAQCNVSVDPGYVVAHCEPGKLSGHCEGTCSGSCEGACNGDCAGACAAKNAQGQCAGRCDGTCRGQCDSTCHAKCEGTWKAPYCEAEVKEPSVDAKCRASCKAHAEVTAQCSEPRVEVHATVNAGDIPKLVATLSANLPALLKAEIGYGKRILDDVEVLVSVGADLPKLLANASAHAAACMGAAADAAVHAQASLRVSVSVSASVSAKAGAHAG